MKEKILVLFFALSVFTTGCYGAPPKRVRYTVWGQEYEILNRNEVAGFVQTGLASWYGKDFHGRKTANGETYDMYGITAAHKSLPLGVFVKVTNMQCPKGWPVCSLRIRVNDRGPFVAGRVIDLSFGAASVLGIIKPGKSKVRVEVVK